jgi:hypothetical protein
MFFVGILKVFILRRILQTVNYVGKKCSTGEGQRAKNLKKNHRKQKIT